MVAQFLSKIIIGLSRVVSSVLNLCTKGAYLAMNKYNQIDYRNFVAGKIREIESMDRGTVEPETFDRAIQPMKELYSWMCANAKD